MNIREVLSNLLGQGTKVEDISAELDQLRLDHALDEYSRAGQLSADPSTRAAAAKLHAQNPDALRTVLTSARLLPAASSITPPTGPTPSNPAEMAIQALMTLDPKLTYHAAAEQASAGGKLEHI